MDILIPVIAEIIRPLNAATGAIPGTYPLATFAEGAAVLS